MAKIVRMPEMFDTRVLSKEIQLTDGMGYPLAVQSMAIPLELVDSTSPGGSFIKLGPALWPFPETTINRDLINRDLF